MSRPTMTNAHHRDAHGGEKDFAAMLKTPGNGLRERAFHYALILSADQPEAEDLAQEALYKAFKAKRSFEPRRSPGPWLRTIVRNTYFDRLRRKRIHRTRSLEELGANREEAYEPPGDKPEPLDELLANETAGLVNETLQALCSTHRTVLRLRHIKGMSYENIAEATRTPLGTVRSRLSRASEEFRRAYRHHLSEN